MTELPLLGGGGGRGGMQEQADLVRVKSLDVYGIVRDILIGEFGLRSIF